MQYREKAGLRLLGSAFVAAILAACGGGGGGAPEAPRVPIARVVVAGDSVADAGTFGFKFTIQNSADAAAGFPLFAQIVAQSFGVQRHCNFYAFTDGAFVPRTSSGCTNLAIGGARIQNVPSASADPVPPSIPQQLAAALQVAGGSYGAADLVLVDGGLNDAVSLVNAYVGARESTEGAVAYRALLAQLLDAATLDATLPQPSGAALAASGYMQRLADVFYAAIKANTLDKGAIHVAVLDLPDITLTPTFRDLLAAEADRNGGGAEGEAAAAALQGVIRQWVDAFNDRLHSRVGDDARMVLVPFSLDFRDEVMHPAGYALSNVTSTACRVDGPGFSFTSCTSADLDARPPAGLAPGWWQSWIFSDGFHLTPYGQRLLAGSALRTIAKAGWQ